MFLQYLVDYVPWTRDLRIRIIIWCRKLAYSLRFLPGDSKCFGPPRKLHYSPNDAPGCVVTELSAEHRTFQTPTTTESPLVATAFRALPNPSVAARSVAQLNNGRYFGKDGGSVVSRDDGLVWILSPTNYPFEVPLHHAFYRILLTPAKKYKKVIHLATRHSKRNYWHWMMDCVTRYRLLKAADIKISDTLDVRWIIDHARLPFQLETLKALSIHEDAVLVSHRYLHIEAETLIIPSYTNPAADTATVTYSQDDLDFLRHLFQTHPMAETMPRMERLYLSRRGPRSITNEKEMISFLRKEGFSVLHCEDLSISRQAQLFSAAKIVIGLHGAALTNILFCKPGTTIIEIMSPDYISPFYWRLSHLAELHHSVYCEDAQFRGVNYRLKSTMPVTVNIKAFERFYKKVALSGLSTFKI